MSNRTVTASDLRQQLAHAEAELVRLNRDLTDAIVAKRPTGSLSTEIAEATAARDRMRSKLLAVCGC
jgi:hypothetical protein